MNNTYNLAINKDAIGLTSYDVKKLAKKNWNVRDSFVFVNIGGRPEDIVDTVSKISTPNLNSSISVADLIDEGDAFFTLNGNKRQLTGDEYVELTQSEDFQESTKISQEKLFESIYKEANNN